MNENVKRDIYEDTRSFEELFPQVEPGIDPTGAKVLLQLRKVKNKTKAGIMLVEESKSTERWNETVALVLAIGPLAYRNRSDMSAWPEGPWCQVGDIVRVVKYGADRWTRRDWEHESINFVLVNDDEVLGKIKSFEEAKRMASFLEE